MQKKNTSKFIIILLTFLSFSEVPLPLNAQLYTYNPETLSGLNYVHNTGPSAVGSFTVSAYTLAAGDPIVISAPTNFEVSLYGTGWGPTATIPNSAGGTLPSTTVYTRLVSGLAIGDYSGNISISGGGTSVTIASALSGSVTILEPPKPNCISGEMLMNIRKEDFGTLPSIDSRKIASEFYIDTLFEYYETGPIDDFGYSIVAESFTDVWTTRGPDHTPDDPPGTYGAMLFVNCGETEGKIIYTRAWPVCTGMDLTMSAWYADAHAHIVYPHHLAVPGITFRIFGGDSPDNCNTLIVKQSESPPYVKSFDQIWHQILVPFNTGNYSYIKLEITNDVNIINGNDILIDDIEFPTAPLPVEVCVTDVSCHGASNGEIKISRVSGNSTFTFVLDGAMTKAGIEATFTGIGAGPHTLKITDQTGECDVVPEIIVNESPELVAKAVSFSSCGSTGTIGMVVTGGIPGYEYREGSGLWSSNSVFTGLTNGSHTIEVKDAQGCITSATTTVSMIATTLVLTSDQGTDSQVIGINSPIKDIVYTAGGNATGVAVTGLPKGLSTSYASGVFTIRGTSMQSGTFNYTVTTTGTDPDCATSLSGTITVEVMIKAEVMDENGNGFIDRINFTLEGQDETKLTDKMPSAGEYFKTLKITNHDGKEISFRPQELERVNDKTFTVQINENSGTDYETGWTSAVFTTNDVSIVASGAITRGIGIVDKAGPVITQVHYEYGEEGKNEDILKITFSEPVVLKNKEISPPLEVFNYYQREMLSTKAFESIDVGSFPFGANMRNATITITNGFFILPYYDSLQLKQVPDHLTDTYGNSAHEKSRVAVIEGKVRIRIIVKPVVNPYVPGTAIPEEFLEYYSDVLKDNNKNVALVAIKSTTPLAQTNNGSFGIAFIYDGTGNLVQRNIPIYQANSPIDYGFTWDAKNMNQRNVNKGVYLAIIKVTDPVNTQHEFRVKIGIE